MTAVTSDPITIEIVADPIIATQPDSLTIICQGGTIPNPLLITDSTGTGVGQDSYQWYYSTTNSYNGTPINSAIYDTFTPITDTLNIGSHYYYVILSFEGNGCTNDTSQIAEIQIIPDPTVTSPCINDSIVCQTSPLATSAFDTLSFTPTGGTGNFTFQWYVNGNQINGANDTFYIPPSNDTGIFQYHCIVQQLPEEIDCWVSTDTCTLIVTDGPSVETPDQDTTICVDGTIDPLTVNPGPNGGQPNYQWYVNGTIITTNGNDSTYQVPTNIAGTYIYECELTFPIGACDAVTSDPITIEIVADPIIATQPDSLTIICQGGTIPNPLLITDSTGTGVGQDSYQWYYSTTNSYNGTPISSAIYDTFTPITDTLNIGSHYYYVILSFEGNGCTNDTSQIAEIQIIPDPTVTSPCINDSIVCQTSPLATSAFDTLSFTPTGGTGNFTFQWYVNGNQINGAIDTFYIPPSNDTGIFQYHCVVQQLPEEIDCWVSTDTCTLIVTDGPSVETPDQDTTICVDGTIDPLTVNPGPNGGQPNYQWYVNGTIITTNGNDSTYQVPTNIAGTYIYECELTFPIGACDL